jgi:protein gp37
MNRTKIEYGTHAWNPVTGCSMGCAWGCWAETVWKRHAAVRAYHGGHDFRTVMLHPERLDEPMRREKPARVLVAFMGDLFGPEVPIEFISKVGLRMGDNPQHQYFLLTKQAGQLLIGSGAAVAGALGRYDHIFLGVTVTTQAEAEARIPLLLATPAARRWISIEPMLGPINLAYSRFTGPESLGVFGLDWVVVGSIDRPSAQWPAPRREWIESIREQCKAAGVPLWEKNNLRQHGIVKDRPLVQELPV